MDNFDKKHEMIQKLLGMLKSHAANEVNTGLAKPEGEGDMHGLEVAHVEMAPHDMDESMPEHSIREEEDQPDEAKMSMGGIVDNVNKGGYKAAPAKAMPSEMQDAHPDKEGAVHKEVGEGMEKRDALTTTEHEEPLDTEYSDAQEEPASMFASFLGKKKRK